MRKRKEKKVNIIVTNKVRLSLDRKNPSHADCVFLDIHVIIVL